jgi:predicted dehydrogenase
LASNLAQASELLAIAKKSGSKTVVGLQTRASPHITKIRSLIQAGAIGDVLSTEVSLALGYDGDMEPPGVDSFTKKEIGANFHTILFAHTADPVFFALGGIPKEVSALLVTRWPKTRLLNADFTVDKVVDREVADHIMMQGILPASGAPISITVRVGKHFKGTPALLWTILGSKGQIRVTSPPTVTLDMGSGTIELFDHESDTVEVVQVSFAVEVKELESPGARNVGMIYEKFAKGETEGEHGFVDFEEAVRVHRLLDAMERSSDEKKGDISVWQYLKCTGRC